MPGDNIDTLESILDTESGFDEDLISSTHLPDISLEHSKQNVVEP